MDPVTQVRSNRVTPTASERMSGWRLLGTVPHRFFFLAGMTQLTLASLWWLAVQATRALNLPAPLGTVPQTAVHALLMIDGFLPMFMFGFAFTAGPCRLGVEPPSPSQWEPPALLAAASTLMLVVVQFADAAAMRIAAAVDTLAWLWLSALFLRLLLSSRAPDKVPRHDRTRGARRWGRNRRGVRALRQSRASLDTRCRRVVLPCSRVRHGLPSHDSVLYGERAASGCRVSSLVDARHHGRGASCPRVTGSRRSVRRGMAGRSDGGRLHVAARRSLEPRAVAK